MNKLNNMTNITHQLIKTSAPKQKVRLIDVDLFDSADCAPELSPYSDFFVTESGHYNITCQIVFQALSESDIDTIQYGLCEKNQSDFSEAFSSVGRQGLSEGCFLSFNMSTVKYMEKDTRYMNWYNVLLNSGSMKYLKEHSKVKLIKL